MLGNGKALGVDYFVWIFFGFALASGFVLSHDEGRALALCGRRQPEAARLSGINMRALRIGAFAFSGFAAGVAGAILISRTGTAIAGDGLADVVFPRDRRRRRRRHQHPGRARRHLAHGARRPLPRVHPQRLQPARGQSRTTRTIIRGAIILFAVAVDALSRRTA